MFDGYEVRMSKYIFKLLLVVVAAALPLWCLDAAESPRKAKDGGGKAHIRKTSGKAKRSEKNLSKENPFEGDREFSGASELDKIVLANLKEKNIPPAKICSDAVFVRRVYLDITGALPSAEDAADFIDSKDANKRAKLVDRLLDSPEYSEYAAFKWADILKIKAEFPINLWPNAAQAYHKYITQLLDRNVPYDKIAYELLTAKGSNFRVPAVNFFRAMQGRGPELSAACVAAAFMGMRFDSMDKEQRANMAAFFSRIKYKSTKEWKEEIVFVDPMTEDLPFNGILPNGDKISLPAGSDPREAFAIWLVRSDIFARNFANRLFGSLTGNYLVSDPDDMLVSETYNKPLLDFLAKSFKESGYDIKALNRLILLSDTYAQSAISQEKDSVKAEQNQAVYRVRRLEAEVLIDALCKITGTSEIYSSMIPEPYTTMPTDKRAVTIPDGSISTPFLEMFGKSQRDTGEVGERDSSPTASQKLYMLNSTHIRSKLERSPILAPFVRMKPTDAAMGLYLVILSRRPNAEELSVVESLSKGQNPSIFIRDLAWALVNTEEFINRH